MEAKDVLEVLSDVIKNSVDYRIRRDTVPSTIHQPYPPKVIPDKTTISLQITTHDGEREQVWEVTVQPKA